MAAPQLSQPRSLSIDFEVLSYVNNLMGAFKAFDSNSDGLITSDELRGIMGSLGYNMSESEVKEMIRQGDTDRDGLLSMHEFLEMNTRELDLGNLADLLQAAVPALGLEVGNDEVVTGEELHNALCSMGGASMEDCMDIIARLDGDGDGAVSLQDLQCIVQALLWISRNTNTPRPVILSKYHDPYRIVAASLPHLRCYNTKLVQLVLAP